MSGRKLTVAEFTDTRTACHLDIGGGKLRAVSFGEFRLSSAEPNGALGILSVVTYNGQFMHAIRCVDGPRIYAGLDGPFTAVEARAWWDPDGEAMLGRIDGLSHGAWMLASVGELMRLARERGWEETVGIEVTR